MLPDNRDYDKSFYVFKKEQKSFDFNIKSLKRGGEKEYFLTLL